MDDGDASIHFSIRKKQVGLFCVVDDGDDSTHFSVRKKLLFNISELTDASSSLLPKKFFNIPIIIKK